jgi:hypothetical protein
MREPGHANPAATDAVMARSAPRVSCAGATITVSLSKILYHPEAIIFAVTPGAALASLRNAAITATRTT